MPLFRTSEPSPKRKPGPRPTYKRRKLGVVVEDRAALSLTQLCLLSLADNMKEVWVKDYADNYMDQYCFMHIMGPFNMLPGELVEELTCLLCSRKQLSRAALHLLLVPQLRALSLASCPGLATAALCTHIAARCQALARLDLSGAQQLSSQTQADLLSCLPALRSLSLAGTPCDRRVIRTLGHYCPALRHLDVSQCHFLSPAALLPLGGGVFSSASSSSSPSGSSLTSPHSTSTSHSSHSSALSNSSSSSSLSPLPLSSLLALDIGFGEEEGDQVATAAYLLLSLPCLEKVAMEGFGQACSLIHHREFGQTEEFTSREGVLCLEEVWRERRMRQGGDRGGKDQAVAEDGEEEEEDESVVWEGYESEDEGMREETSGDEGMSGCQGQGGNTRTESRGETERDRAGNLVSKSGDESMNLRLKEVKGLSFASLEAVSRLCPDLLSITLDFNEEEDTGGRSLGSLLATGLKTWSGQLRSLSLRYPGPLVDLLPALQAAGSSLVSLTLEGVKASPHTPLLELIQACPRLRDLLIHADPPPIPQEEEEEEEEMEDDRDLPSLPYLRSLTINFSYEQSQKLPVMSWRSLRRALKCLLSGSPLLEVVSLVAVPCNVNPVFQYILSRPKWNLGHNRYRGTDSSELPPQPLGQLHHLSLARTNVTMRTVWNIVEGCKRIRFLDLRSCWEIKRLEWMSFQHSTNITLIWT